MGDDAGFECFVRTHGAGLLRTAALLSGSRDRGEDLLQETLTHLYPRWSRVAATEVPVAYVRRSLVNRFISAHRSPRRADISVWEVPEQCDGRDLGEDVATRRWVWEALGRLPERQRAAVVLRFYLDLADEEIAAILGCREVTVRSIVRRAMAAMRDDRTLGFAGGKADAR